MALPGIDEERRRSRLGLPRIGRSAPRPRIDKWDMLLPLLQPPLAFEFPETLDIPSELYEYQPEAIEFLATRQSALLGDQMGLGKTVETVVAMRLLFQTGKIRSALVVCPKSVLDIWDRHLEEWSPHLSVALVQGSKEARQQWWIAGSHVKVVTYAAIRQDIKFVGLAPTDTDFDLVVLDECQNIKNPATGYSSAVKALRCTWRWGLSGTPVENELGDLVSIFEFLKPGLFPPAGSRRAKDLTPQQARETMKPYFLRRRRDVLKDLPSMTVEPIWLSLDEDQRRAYDRAVQEGVVYLRELGQEASVPHVLALLGKLKEICNRDPETGQSTKLDWVLENVEQMTGEGDKCLIFSQYRKGAGVGFLSEQLTAYKPLQFTGEMSTAQRRTTLAEFRDDPERPLLLLTLRAGGVGLNLTAASYGVLFDHWWNPATGHQAAARMHRPGQTKPVSVYQLWVGDTVERRIYDILAQKQRLYDDVIDSLSVDGAKTLSEEELFGLFDLSPPRRRARQVSPADLGSLSPRQFEEKVAELWERTGYGVRLTSASRDEGVDVIATRQTVGGIEKIAIQCKRQEQVGVEVARGLLGTLEADHSFTKGIIVASGRFSADCQEFVRSIGRLELVDGPSLCRGLGEHGVSV